MNTEQVSALSDVELNRAMIWLYRSGHVAPIVKTWGKGKGVDLYYATKGSSPIDYLREWGRTMPLAVEQVLAIEFNPQGTFAGLGYSESINDNPLRAICEVLVLIKCQ